MFDALGIWTTTVWDYYRNPPPTPEKSPADKALDDFIAKRKAKREAVDQIATDADIKSKAREVWEHKTGKELGRALSKAYVHHSEIGERLMPFKVVL